MKLISMMEAAEKYKLSETQIKRMFYKRDDVPKRVGTKPRPGGGKVIQLFNETEVDAFITGILNSEILRDGEIDFVGISKIMGKSRGHTAYIFRNDVQNAPKPIRYTAYNAKQIYRIKDVLPYVQHYLQKLDEPKERKKDIRARLRVAPANNPAFDNSLVVKFLSRADAIRPRLERISSEPPKTVRVQLEGDWG